MNWNDPVERFRLIESVGIDEYNRRIAEHKRQQIIETINGFEISLVPSTFGPLYFVQALNVGYRTIEEARKRIRGQ